MKHNISISILLASSLLVSGSLLAKEVYTWRGQSGVNSYSDVPRNLRQAGSGVVNIRTQTVTPIAPPAPDGTSGNQLPQIQGNQGEVSAAELQAQANQRMLEENRQREEANRKTQEANAATKANNCNAAKVNLQYAQTARVENRDQLIRQFQDNVKQYCN